MRSISRSVCLLLLSTTACSDPLPPPAALNLPPEATAEPPEWVALNSTQTIAVTQTRADRKCEVAARAKGAHETLWKTEICVAERRHLRFVSEDGKALAVIDPTPTVDENGDAVLATVWRTGWALKPVTLRQVFPRGTNPHIENGKLWWLADLGSRFDVQGHESTVALTLADGRRAALFYGDGVLSIATGEDAETPAAEASAQARAPVEGGCRQGPCTYVDGLGTFHMVATPDQIPDAFRGTATPLRGDGVNVVAEAEAP